MRRSFRVIAAAMALSCVTTNVMAAAGCARPQDLNAIKTAAVQQRLMVAALSCDAINLYNRFVTTYQRELQTADRALENFFRRINGAAGPAAYNAFKTKLANASSMTSVGNMTAFCNRAQESFGAALNTADASLASFLVTQPYTDDEFSVCDPSAMTTVAAAVPPPSAPSPRYKPLDVVMPAQGLGLRPSMGLRLDAY